MLIILFLLRFKIMRTAYKVYAKDSLPITAYLYESDDVNKLYMILLPSGMQ